MAVILFKKKQIIVTKNMFFFNFFVNEFTPSISTLNELLS